MKTITALFFIACYINGITQENSFIIQGNIMDENGNPISDVYVINPRTFEKEITRQNGIFSITVFPRDSLVFSHISYLRKFIRVSNLQQNSTVVLETENVQIPQINISPKQLSDMERAQKNLTFLNNYKPLKYNKMKPEVDPLETSMTEHNRLMRSEAGSISFLPLLGFAFKQVDKAVQKRRRRKLHQTDYFSTKKQKKLLPENEEQVDNENN